MSESEILLLLVAIVIMIISNLFWKENRFDAALGVFAAAVAGLAAVAIPVTTALDVVDPLVITLGVLITSVLIAVIIAVTGDKGHKIFSIIFYVFAMISIAISLLAP